MRVSRRVFQAEGTESVDDGKREDSTSKNWVMLGRNWVWKYILGKGSRKSKMDFKRVSDTIKQSAFRREQSGHLEDHSRGSL